MKKNGHLFLKLNLKKYLYISIQAKKEISKFLKSIFNFYLDLVFYPLFHALLIFDLHLSSSKKKTNIF